MFQRITTLAIFACGVVFLAFNACDVNAPDRLVRAPIIRAVSPQASVVDAVAGVDTVCFSVRAFDPGDEELSFVFSLDDSVVSDSSTWCYVVDDTGAVDITVKITNGRLESSVSWRLNRLTPFNAPPIIVDATPSDNAPSIEIGKSIEFAITAEDPEGLDISYLYLVNDTIVAATRKYIYNSHYVGLIEVRAIASDGARFAIHLWDLTVQPEPDSLIPAEVQMVSLVTGDEPGELIAEWIAVGDDGMAGRPSQYLVRTSSVPIETETSWAQSSQRSGVPAPEDPGTVMRMVVTGLNPANLVHLAVRARDAFGNLSPLRSSMSELTKGMEITGTVRDALTNLPIGGVRVRLAGNEMTTGPDGKYALTELPAALSPQFLWDDPNAGQYGAYSDMVTDLYDIQHDDVRDFWLVPIPTLVTNHYSNLLAFLKAMAMAPLAGKTFLNTWNTPINVYIPPFVKNGLDYEQIIKEQFQRWEELLEMQIFNFVIEDPVYGVRIVYDGSATREFYEVLEREGNLPKKSQITMRTKYEDRPDGVSERTMRTIVSHEVGHALGMAHSTDQGHLMIGGRSSGVPDATLDEIWLGRIMYNMPPGINLNWYLFD